MELTLSELAIQQAELLPERETLLFDFNWANIYATNAAYAVNACVVLLERKRQRLPEASSSAQH